MTITPRSRSTSISSIDSNAPPTFTNLAPPRAPTTLEFEETIISIPGLRTDVKLKVDAGPGCGGIAWPAGEVLSKYIAHRQTHSPSYLFGRTILELGSGTGLVGIVAALLEPTSKVWITDQLPLLNLMTQNSILNLPEINGKSNIEIAEYNWGEDPPLTIPIEEVSLILAADCVYFEPAFPLLVKTLCDLAPIGKEIEILFCWKKRRKADKRFFALLKKHFDLEIVMDDKEGERERYTREGVSLTRLKRRR